MPDWREAIRQRLEKMSLPPTREAEIVEELSQHLEDRYRELRAEGAPEKAAIQEALEELDETDLVQELAGVEREDTSEPLAVGVEGGGAATGGLWHDVRFGARLVAKEKGVSLVIVLTLALAIAANTLVFAMTDLIVLRPLPFGNAARLTEIRTFDPRQNDTRGTLSLPQYLDVTRQASAFEAVAAMTPRQLSLTGSGEPAAVGAVMVTANFFKTVGVEAVAGRTFLANEDQPGQSDVVVLSHRFWTARFNRDLTLIGRTVTLNGIAHTVIGVATPAIETGTLTQIDVWLPLETAAPGSRLVERSIAVFGLLDSSHTVETANAELDTISERLRTTYPVTDGSLRLRAIAIRESNVTEDTWVLLALLTTIVGLVLLLACANVATVTLARATTRRREIALRLALGATRPRLVRQLISEGMLLGLMAGVIGVVLAYGGVTGIKLLAPDAYMQLLEINTNVLLFALALSILAPVLFGTIPAFQASRPDITEDLKEGGRDGSPSLRAHRSRAALVTAQVAFALTVLIVSGLVVRSVTTLQSVPLGLNVNDVLCMRVRFDPPKYVDDAARTGAVDALLTRFAALPGVVAAAATTRVPILDPEPVRQFTVVGRAEPAAADVPWALEATMTAGYRETFQLPVLEGRLFSDGDRAGSAPVAVLSREAARRYWPAQSPIGQRITLMGGPAAPTGEPIEIVGVVDDVKTNALSQPGPPRLYRPLAQRSSEATVLAVRVRGEGLSIVPLIREALRAEDRDLAVSEIQPLETMIGARLLRSYDLIVALFVVFGAIGLVLAVTGVYGVTAFSVGQRQHEIGVRLAMGATGGSVIRAIVARGFKPIAIGMAIGALGGWAVGTTMRGLLFQTAPLDPSTYLTVTALIAVGGLLASVVPAHRAASIEPTSVLKRE